MKLCFLGFGEAAFEMSYGLKGEGFTEIYAYDVMQNDDRFGPTIKERAAKAEITLLPSLKELAENADFLFCMVPANFSISAAESIVPMLKKGTYYCDLTASTPDAKKKIAEIVAPSGAVFTDGAMLGALVVYHHKVPIIVSGEGAAKMIEAFTPYGMDIKQEGSAPGDASAIKLIRSIYMKGTASLVIEMLTAASHFGVSDQVIPSLAATFDSKTFVQTMERLATGTSVHAQRRGAELSGSLQMLEDAGLASTMTRAAYDTHMRLAKANVREKLGGKPPKDWQEAIKLLNE